MEPTARPPRVAVIGGASWNTMIQVERFPDPGPATVWPLDWYDAVGSSGAGKALNLARLGVDVTLHAALGEDADGDRVADHLTKAGIRLLRGPDRDGTARHVNLMDPRGRRMSFLLQRRTAPELDQAALESAIVAADAVCLEIVDYARHLVPLIQRHHRPTWTDLHDYDGSNPHHEDFIDAAEVVLLSADRLGDPRPVMERLLGRGKRLVVCTLAERGAIALTEDGRWHDVPAEPATVVDTNGAGDAFAAGLLVAELLGLPLERGLRMAAMSAASAIGARELASPELTLDRLLDGIPG